MKNCNDYLPPEVDVVTILPKTDFCSTPINTKESSQDYEYDDDYSLS